MNMKVPWCRSGQSRHAFENIATREVHHHAGLFNGDIWQSDTALDRPILAGTLMPKPMDYTYPTLSSGGIGLRSHAYGTMERNVA